MPSRNRAAIFWLLGTMSVLNVACSPISSAGSSNQSQPVTPSPTPFAALPADLELAPPPQNPSLAAKDAYERALDVAYSAELLGESAVSADDWQLSLSRWQEAIALLRKVPTNSAFYALAKPKIAEYQRNLSEAQQLATRPRPNTPTGIIIATAPATPTPSPNPATPQTDKPPVSPTPLKTNRANQQIFSIPIKRRAGRTPVIDVTFNGKEVFEMIIDTGASGTVITQEMAQSLGVTPEGEVTADTASNKGVKFSTTTVESIAVAGAVAKNVRVAIASDALEVGLLGQDFFGNYDVLIKQDVIEFHRR